MFYACNSRLSGFTFMTSNPESTIFKIYCYCDKLTRLIDSSSAMAKWILAVILIIVVLSEYCKLQALAVEIVIHPEGSNCTEIGSIAQCYPISSLYMDNPNRLEIVSNSTFLFQPGVYFLESSILIQDVRHIMIHLLHNNYSSDINDLSQIYCKNRSGLFFINTTNVIILNVIMNNCGANISQILMREDIALPIRSKFLNMSYANWVKTAIFAANVHNLTMYDTIINGSHGYGILGVNILGDSFILESWFNSSNTVSLTDHCMSSSLTYLESTECQGGNALFLYYDHTDCPLSRDFHSLIIYRSFFLYGVHPPPPSEYINITHVGGFGLRLSQNYYDVDVAILNSTFAFNGILGSDSNSNQGLSIRLAKTIIYSYILIDGSDFIIGSGIFLVNNAQLLDPEIQNVSCAGILDADMSQNEATETQTGKLLHILNCEFRSNRESSLTAIFRPAYITTKRVDMLLIQHCRFEKNTAIEPTIQVLDFGTNPHSETVIEDTYFYSNGNTTGVNEFITIDIEIIASLVAVVKVESVRNVTFRNCIFLENRVSAISAQRSHIFFEGIHHFANNSAFHGGALFLSRSSVVLLRPGTVLYFTNNRALRKGGAIFIEGNRNELFFYECHIQVYDPALHSLSQLGIHIFFSNNIASEAGDAIYGGQIDTCQALSPSGFFVYNRALVGQFIFDMISRFEPQDTSSLISSDALYICFCMNDTFNLDFDCSIREITVSHYPGEMFHILMIGLGQRNGTVPAVVFAHLASCSNIEGSVTSIQTKQTCSMINCSLSSSSDVEYLVFEVDAQIAVPNPLSVEIIVQDCETLVGFTLDNVSGVCVCMDQLKNRNMICSIDSKIITRQPPHWLGNYSNHLLLHDNCPYDYCKPGQVQIVMIEPNISDQCAFNRYGTLCGSCREGFSHVFGSSRCLNCSNIYVLLIIPFALVGIALVAFLFILNLTVAIGSINGLIFYANIIKINEAVFFPPGDSSPFRVFISWVNLDLGIETCFYDGMDSYAKTWFQFLFPFYLWFILSLIILASRHSTIVVYLFGKHSVEVLATIFLLSFTKLLRTITTALSFTTLKFPDGDRALWLYDGNFKFGTNSHSALLLFSVLFLTAIALPYALLLLFVQPLRRYSHFYLLRWVTKMWPIFDAYLGPYGPKQGYWTGLLLSARLILVAVFAFNVLGNPAVNVFVIILISMLLIVLNLAQGGVYKSKYLTALEISYILNLILLAAATTLVKQGGGSQQYVVYISTSAALFIFAATLVYHATLRVKDCIKNRKVFNEGSISLRVHSQSVAGPGVVCAPSEDADYQGFDKKQC